MLFRYESLTVNKHYTAKPEDKTHLLYFRMLDGTPDPMPGAVGPMIGTAAGMLSLPMTEAEASKYTLGYEYSQTLAEFPPPSTPAAPQE